MFAQKKVTLPPGKHKIIILDEADSMTSGAQQALRRLSNFYFSRKLNTLQNKLILKCICMILFISLEYLY